MTFSSATTRRHFLAGAGALAAAPLLAAKPAPKSHLKIGVTDWNLHLSGKLEAVALAASLGFEGVQISLGNKPVDGKLPLAGAPQTDSLAECESRQSGRCDEGRDEAPDPA